MKGIFSALPVPFDLNGNIKKKELRQIVRYNIDVIGIDGLYVNGSTGESFLISTEEKKEILSIAIDEAKNKTQLIAQIGSLNLKEAVELGKFATDIGYKTLSAVTPFYFSFDLEEIKYYYETIINATGNQMVVYCIPSTTNVTLNFKQLKEIFSIDGVLGIKYTHNDFYLLERIRKEFPEKIIYSGFDQMLASAAVLGVDGAIGSTHNLVGKRAKEIYRLVKAGRNQEAAKLQGVQNDFIEKIVELGIFQTLKELFKLKGIDAGYCREPFKKFPKEKRSELKKLLALCD